MAAMSTVSKRRQKCLSQARGCGGSCVRRQRGWRWRRRLIRPTPQSSSGRLASSEKTKIVPEKDPAEASREPARPSHRHHVGSRPSWLPPSSAPLPSPRSCRRLHRPQDIPQPDNVNAGFGAYQRLSDLDQGSDVYLQDQPVQCRVRPVDRSTDIELRLQNQGAVNLQNNVLAQQWQILLDAKIAAFGSTGRFKAHREALQEGVTFRMGDQSSCILSYQCQGFTRSIIPD